MAGPSSVLPFRSYCRPLDRDGICVLGIYYVPDTAPGTQRVGTALL